MSDTRAFEDMLPLTEQDWSDLETICWGYCTQTDWIRSGGPMRDDMERDMPAELEAIKRRRLLAAQIIHQASGVPLPAWASHEGSRNADD